MRWSGNLRNAILFLSLPGLSIIACGASGASTTVTVTAQPTELTSPTAIMGVDPYVPSAVVTTPDRSSAEPIFKIAVIVDTLSEPVTQDQSQNVINEASGFLKQLVPVSLEMTDFVQDGNGGTMNEMAARYLGSHPTVSINGILIFSFGDNGQAKVQNGYGYAIPGPAGFRNAFVTPTGGANQIYISIVRFGLKYMACGYGGTDTVQSTTSMGSECRDKPGTACVQNNGYSMCSDAAGLYLSTATHFVSSTVIHEFLHSFSPGGDKDNYATPECNNRMGYPDGFFDLQESQYYNEICPFVYEDFLASYQP